MGDKEWSPSDVFDVFGDALSRQILVLASEQPLSADDLAEYLDTSAPTVYRRLNGLQEYDLITESQQIDTDGNHYQTFETTMKRISFELTEGGYKIDLQMRHSLADRFDSFWTDLEQSSRHTEHTPAESADDNLPDDPSHG